MSKMSKKEGLGLVPKLRFPEFAKTGEWGKLQLNEIANRITDKVGNKKLTTLSISAGVGFVSQVEKFSRDISGKQYENYIYLKKGDFSYNKGNSKKFPQGCIYELKEYSEAAVPNAFISFHVNENYVSSFYKGYFDSNFHGKQLTRFITSGARSDGLLNISPTDFLSIIFPTPKSKAEQEKIADCLSSLDDIISLEDKKHTSLKEHKKGLMQKLFPADGKTVPELRFKEFQNSPNWETKKLNELLDYERPDKYIVKDTNYINVGIPVLTANKSFILGYTNETEGIYENIPIIIFDDFTVSHKYVDFPFKIKSSAIKILKSKDDNILKFIHELMSTIKFDPTEHKRYYISTFQHLIVAVPQTMIEQQKIAECLSSLDDLISAQAEKIGALKIHKKYLMQNLFPSTKKLTA